MELKSLWTIRPSAHTILILYYSLCSLNLSFHSFSFDYMLFFGFYFIYDPMFVAEGKFSESVQVIVLLIKESSANTSLRYPIRENKHLDPTAVSPLSWLPHPQSLMAPLPCSTFVCWSLFSLPKQLKRPNLIIHMWLFFHFTQFSPSTKILFEL